MRPNVNVCFFHNAASKIVNPLFKVTGLKDVLKMNKRKLIAVISGKINSYNEHFINGIIYQANLLGCNVAVFSFFSLYTAQTRHQLGDEQIFSLINFDKVDGIIFADFTFWSDRVKNKVINILKQNCSVPVMCMNSDLPPELGFHNVRVSDKQCFFEITSHLIVHHNLTKIYCLTGIKNTYIASERLSGYIEAMTANGLSVPDKYIFYGDFWTQSAQNLAYDIASGKIEKPQAIVCASDIMAIALTNALTEHNINVPSEIAVTGFDALADSMLNTPSITTYYSQAMLCGTKCVCSLLNIIMNRHIYNKTSSTGHLVLNDSCGCKMSDSEFVKKIKSRIRHDQATNSTIEASNMYEKLAEATDITSFISAVDELTYLIDGYERYFLCLNENITDNNTCRNGNSYSEKMTIALDKIEFSRVYKNIIFSSQIMLPELFEETSKPDAFFFTPLHFDDKCFGYSVITFKDKSKIIDNSYYIWAKNVSNALHFVISKAEPANNIIDSDNIYSESTSSIIPPKWFFELINKMNFVENFTQGLPKMLKLAHISQEHLTREFRKYLNMSPTEFINDKRLTYAAELLSEEKYDITSICFMSGFNNLSHFYHKFKEKYKCSPKQYIKNKNNRL